MQNEPFVDHIKSREEKRTSKHYREKRQRTHNSNLFFIKILDSVEDEKSGSMKYENWFMYYVY